MFQSSSKWKHFYWWINEAALVCVCVREREQHWQKKKKSSKKHKTSTVVHFGSVLCYRSKPLMFSSSSEMFSSFTAQIKASCFLNDVRVYVHNYLKLCVGGGSARVQGTVCGPVRNVNTAWLEGSGSASTIMLMNSCTVQKGACMCVCCIS